MTADTRDRARLAIDAAKQELEFQSREAGICAQDVLIPLVTGEGSHLLVQVAYQMWEALGNDEPVTWDEEGPHQLDGGPTCEEFVRWTRAAVVELGWVVVE